MAATTIKRGMTTMSYEGRMVRVGAGTDCGGGGATPSLVVAAVVRRRTHLNVHA